MNFASDSSVMPDLIRHPASACGRGQSSGTPDQVRGDGFLPNARRLFAAILLIGTANVPETAGAQPASIPSSFQGHWNKYPQNCSGETEGEVRITASRFSGDELDAEILSYTVLASDKISVKSRDRKVGAGLNIDFLTIEASQKSLVWKNSDGHVTRLFRCELARPHPNPFPEGEGLITP
ncbi:MULTISPECIES: hypothetical protein [unclassified Sphingobium]|uniref:hypothetical protein n=1 Tax=unclassified Sphingobium TaxID=2611147 RepID=UPI0035A71293